MSNNFTIGFQSNNSKRQQWSLRKKLNLGLNRNKKKKLWKTQKNSEYLPLMSDDNSSDDEITVHDSSIFQLRQRNSPKNIDDEISRVKDCDGAAVNGFKDTNSKCDSFRNRELITVKVKKEDTLQSISLKYRCSISDIKRANNLISDLDFHALPQLKIPVRRHGILSQILMDRDTATNNETSDNLDDGNDNIRVINIGLMLSNNSPQEAAEFLKRMDEDLVKIVLNTKTQKDSLEEAAAALTAPRIHPLGKDDPYSDPHVMCNIQWSYILVVLVIISIASIIVIFYINYIRASHSVHLNETFFNNSTKESFSSEKTDFLDKT